MLYLFRFPELVSRGLFESQLLPIIKYLNNKGNSCKVYFGENKEKQLFGKEYVTLKDSSSYKKCFRSADFVYLRNVYDFPSIYLKKHYLKNSFKIIYDFRGFTAYESLYVQNNYLKFLIALFLEFLIYRLSDYITVVSNEFKRQLFRHFGTKKNVQILPCCISLNYVNKKTEINILENKFKFVYCGGTQKWQKFDEMLMLFKNILATYPQSTLKIYTRDVENAKNISDRLSVKNISIETLEHERLMVKLKEYHFAFLLRDNAMINNVASPIKFAEYLSAGLITILSPYIGDYSNQIKVNRIGILTDKNFQFEISKIEKYKHNKDLGDKIFKQSYKLTWEYNLPLIKVYNYLND